ncbi:class II peroxidase [Venturia nashicola]|uniref:Peroxidase n=1 Tax=Venturia nashicola TaxID=86259 RepID=A0A4Z1NYZ9_9PEZI|nr:class II peroxidase [Venturia nashicola]
MKFINVVLSSALATTVLAYPGAGKWKKTLSELQRRTATPVDSPEDSNELLGDLLTTGPTTSVGKLVADLLVGKADAVSTEIITAAPAPLGSDACKQDTCCIWKYVADDMLAQFKGQSSRCNNAARGAIRLGFHDAAAWQKGAAYGGADGSILLTDEINRSDNKGLEEIAALTKTMYAKYQSYGISMADFIQMGATVATVACPLGPRIRSFVGRKDNPTAAIENLLPDVNADADSLIKLFEDKTIRAHGLTALLGAHTTSQQRFFNPERAQDPQDSTPGVWDVAVYPQTLDPNAPKRVLKFPSDVKISVHPRTASEWKAFADPKTGQAHWNDDYSKEYIRLSVLGVNNINDLTECSKVLPPAITDFQPPDKSNVDIWANGGFQNLGSKFGELMAGGSLTTNQTLPQLGIDPMQAWSGFGRSPPGTPSTQPGNFPGQGAGPPPSFPSGRPSPPANGGGRLLGGQDRAGQAQGGAFGRPFRRFLRLVNGS